MNLLYITMDLREARLGIVLLFLYFAMLILFSGMGSIAFFLCCLIWTVLAGVFFRRFIRDSFQVPQVTAGQIIWKAILGAMISQLSQLLTNDLIFYFIPTFFTYTDVGPQLNLVIHDTVSRMAQEQYLLTAISAVILLPVVEELLFRGLLFGRLYRHSRLAAFLVTLTLFTLVRVVPLMGHHSALYLVVCAIQYVPMTIYLSWVYTNSETVLTPMLAHMIINGVSFSMLR